MKKPKREPRKIEGLIIRKGCKHLEGVQKVDYKDHELLRKFTSENGKIIPRRLTGANARQQRQVKRAIRQARTLGLAS